MTWEESGVGEEERRWMQKDVTAVHCGSLFLTRNDVSGSKENSLAHFSPLEIFLSQLLGLRAPAVTLH